MPLINRTRLPQKEKIKAEISSDIYHTIQEYCNWASIENISFFLEEASSFVFAKDKEWKQFKKSKKKQLQSA